MAYKEQVELAFGEIYAADAASTVTISTSGKANKVQITAFNTNGQSNNSTPDHTNDHITVDVAGKYLVDVSLVVESVSAGSIEIGVSLWKNNGATEFQNVYALRELSGSGGDTGSLSLSGICDLAENDTIEVWLWNNTNNNNVVVDNITLSIIKIG